MTGVQWDFMGFSFWIHVIFDKWGFHSEKFMEFDGMKTTLSVN